MMVALPLSSFRRTPEDPSDCVLPVRTDRQIREDKFALCLDIRLRRSCEFVASGKRIELKPARPLKHQGKHHCVPYTLADHDAPMVYQQNSNAAAKTTRDLSTDRYLEHRVACQIKAAYLLRQQSSFVSQRTELRVKGAKNKPRRRMTVHDATYIRPGFINRLMQGQLWRSEPVRLFVQIEACAHEVARRGFVKACQRCLDPKISRSRTPARDLPLIEIIVPTERQSSRPYCCLHHQLIYGGIMSFDPSHHVRHHIQNIQTSECSPSYSKYSDQRMFAIIFKPVTRETALIEVAAVK
jgi:hypothetical protein